MAIATVNPATNTTLKTFTALTPDEVDAAIGRAEFAFGSYRTTGFQERAAWMTRAAEILEAEKVHLGRLMATEMGKTARSAAEEAAKCAWACRYYAENARAVLADETVATSAGSSYITYQPLGIILAVMPWNFPFWQVFRFIAPSLMAGNVGLLKHASNVPPVRPQDRGDRPARRVPRRRLPVSLDRRFRRGAGPRRPAREGGDAHRQRAGRDERRGDRGARDQADRPGTRRERPVHRHAVGGC
jgi:hypothetical protein